MRAIMCCKSGDSYMKIHNIYWWYCIVYLLCRSEDFELPQATRTQELSDGVTYRVTVTNTGKVLGDRVVQAYIQSVG